MMRGMLPEPIGLDPRPISVDEYCDGVPEKLELLDGYLIDGPADSAARVKLLRLLLANVGLRGAVALAPRASWLAALQGDDADRGA